MFVFYHASKEKLHSSFGVKMCLVGMAMLPVGAHKLSSELHNLQTAGQRKKRLVLVRIINLCVVMTANSLECSRLWVIIVLLWFDIHGDLKYYQIEADCLPVDLPVYQWKSREFMVSQYGRIQNS